MQHQSPPPNLGERRTRARMAMGLAVAAGAALGMAVVALSASAPPAPGAGDVYLDTAPVHEGTTSSRQAQASGRLDTGVNTVYSVAIGSRSAPLAVASYER